MKRKTPTPGSPTPTRGHARCPAGREAHFTSLRYTILLGPLQRAGGLRACHPLARHVTKARVHACLVGTQPCTEGALRGEVGKHGEGASVNERRDDEEDEVDQPLRRGMRSGAGVGACGACGRGRAEGMADAGGAAGQKVRRVP